MRRPKYARVKGRKPASGCSRAWFSLLYASGQKFYGNRYHYVPEIKYRGHIYPTNIKAATVMYKTHYIHDDKAKNRKQKLYIKTARFVARMYVIGA